MSPNTPAGLLRKVFLHTVLEQTIEIGRGSEGQRIVHRESFKFEKDADADGIDSITMSHEELTKNHQGGFTDKSIEKRQTPLYSTAQDDDAS